MKIFLMLMFVLTFFWRSEQKKDRVNYLAFFSIIYLVRICLVD